jgi:hypothetical protein
LHSAAHLAEGRFREIMTPYRVCLGALALTLLLGIAIAVLTLSPLPDSAVPGSDKLHHILAMAALSFPLPFARRKLVVPVVLGALLYGGAIEIIQPFVGRDAALGDFWADVAGAILGASSGAIVGGWLLGPLHELTPGKENPARAATPGRPLH